VPTFSIIIVAKNAEKFLAKNLESLKKQSFKDFEIIVVDNNSKDSTFQIAKKFGVKIFKEKKNFFGWGTPAARNKGIKNASGRYIAFIDADCTAPPYWLERYLKIFQKNPNIYAIGGKTIHLPGNTVVSRYCAFTFNKHQLKSYIETRNGVFKREVFEKIGLFNEKHWVEDVEFSLRMKENNLKFILTPEVEVYHIPPQKLNGLFKGYVRYAIGTFQIYKPNFFNVLKSILIHLKRIFVNFLIKFPFFIFKIKTVLNEKDLEMHFLSPLFDSVKTFGMIIGNVKYIQLKRRVQNAF